MGGVHQLFSSPFSKSIGGRGGSIWVIMNCFCSSLHMALMISCGPSTVKEVPSGVDTVREGFFCASSQASRRTARSFWVLTRIFTCFPFLGKECTTTIQYTRFQQKIKGKALIFFFLCGSVRIGNLLGPFPGRRRRKQIFKRETDARKHLRLVGQANWEDCSLCPPHRLRGHPPPCVSSGLQPHPGEEGHFGERAGPLRLGHFGAGWNRRKGGDVYRQVGQLQPRTAFEALEYGSYLESGGLSSPESFGRHSSSVPHHSFRFGLTTVLTPSSRSHTE